MVNLKIKKKKQKLKHKKKDFLPVTFKKGELKKFPPPPPHILKALIL